MNTIPTSELIDTFGMLKAQAAEVTQQLADIKDTLIAREGEFKGEGELFRLSLSHSLRSTVDKDAIIRALAKEAGITDKRLDNLFASNTSLADNWVARSAARVTK
jgi:hypothetical protein